MKFQDSYFFKTSFNRYLIVAVAILMLIACNPRTDQLSAREASISARESELVTLFAELVEQKKSLEKLQADEHSVIKENSENSNQCSCEEMPTETKENHSTKKTDNQTIIGEVEYVYLDPPGMEFTARIDTGAQTSSLNALDIVEFERDGKPFVKFNTLHPLTGEMVEMTRRLRSHVRIKEPGEIESQRRPVVRMRIVLGNIDEQINFTLTDRSKLAHQVLLGRNLLRDLAIVDVSKKFTTIRMHTSEKGDSK